MLRFGKRRRRASNTDNGQRSSISLYDRVCRVCSTPDAACSYRNSYLCSTCRTLRGPTVNATRATVRAAQARTAIERIHVTWGSVAWITERDKRYEAQGQACGICGDHLSKRSAVLDHNHETKKIRGVLCRSCNAVIGAIERGRSLFHKAMLYLDTY